MVCLEAPLLAELPNSPSRLRAQLAVTNLLLEVCSATKARATISLQAPACSAVAVPIRRLPQHRLEDFSVETVPLQRLLQLVAACLEEEQEQVEVLPQHPPLVDCLATLVQEPQHLTPVVVGCLEVRAAPPSHKQLQPQLLQLREVFLEVDYSVTKHRMESLMPRLPQQSPHSH